MPKGDKQPGEKTHGRSSGDSRSSQRQRDPQANELRRFEPVSDAQVLAAIERAEVHHERQNEGILRSDLAEHLGFVHGGWTTRQLRPQLDALRSGGMLRDVRRHGLNLLGITDAGRRALTKARRAGGAGELPESPQHRRWRQAHVAAAGRIDGFRQQMRDALDEASRLLDAEQAPSDAWFILAGRLKTECLMPL